MNLKSEIKSAIGAHGLWKSRLASAIDTGSSEFSSSVVRRDDQCQFGKWLHTADPIVRTSPYYHKCLEAHRQFHTEAAKVLELALVGKKEEAKQFLISNSGFTKASASLTTIMMEWAAKG